MDTLDVTEEQRLRADKNRLAALAKRKAIDESSATNPQDPWRLFKCRKFTCQENTLKIAPFTKRQENVRANAVLDTLLKEKFRVRLEICSHDSFSVTPVPVERLPYPGEDECFKRLGLFLGNVISTHYTQNLTGGKACVYKLWDYDAVVRCLKSANNIEYEEIPWGTLNVIRRISDSFITGRWTPCRPEHLPDETVNELISKLPKKILDALLPFQLDGVKFGLQRGGRCLIADEMGLGKTLQAIAIACCFMNEGSILIVCPAILRYSWAEELERWFPCLPKDIHLVFDHQSSPSHLKKWPKIVVISYKMLFHLRKTMLDREWAFLIVDESHHIRCSKKVMEPLEAAVVIDIAMKVKRVVLLSGTPSLSRPYDIFHQINILWPGLLGKDKYDFAKTYCDITSIGSSQGQVFKNYSRGTRLEELNILLRSTVMIRRLKEHVMVDLPPKRRQIIRLLLKKSDILSVKSDANANKPHIFSVESNAAEAPHGASGNTIATGSSLENSKGSNDNAGVAGHSSHGRKHMLSYLELGIAKLSKLHDWLSLHPLFAAPDDGAVDSDTDISPSSHKMIIFAHHHRVLDGIQEYICEKGIGFVRIDGNTLPKDRQSAVLSFQSSLEVKIAIIGITAGGVGLNLSSAKTVVFLELPPSPSWMLQAEDRAHRRGQTNAVNIYYFCAKDTMDDVHWQYLNKSLYRISSTTNGKRDAIKEIVVDDVSYLDNSYDADRNYIQLLGDIACSVQPPELKQNSDLTTENIHFSEAYENASPNDAKNDVKCTLSMKTSQQEASNPPTEIRKHGLGATVTDDENSLNMGNLLRFEVSQYTGRIHLYCCTEGLDHRPRPLFESFRPEEFTLEGALDNEKNTTLKIFKNCQAYRQVREFINQWNKLRPIERRRLQGKPLQLPLAVELYYLNEGTNHDSRGLLNGKSRRRTTPLIEISHPLPANAEWKKVRLIANISKKEKEYTQGWTSMGEPLCKLCQLPCRNENSMTPEFFEDLFCNLSCYEEYRIRTSRIFLREELFRIEHGVCTNCRLDCHQLVKCIKRLPLEKRREHLMRTAPKLVKRKKLLEKLVNNPSAGNAWHADHIVPVFQGGGECSLENMRTLCVDCHYEVTAAQQAERRTARVEAKKRLKGILSALKNDSEVGVAGSKTKDDLHMVIPEKAEDELLVTVPGSSYTVRDESIL